MQKIYSAVTAVAGYLPPDRLTNQDLEKMVETTDEWIRSRTGIHERRILKSQDPHEPLGTSDMVVPVIRELCRKRGILPTDIDCLIVATVTSDYPFPATANVAADKVGAVNAWSFDINAACSGFLYALTVGASLVESGRYQKVVVVGADKMSSIIDYEDRNTCIIFGDGAGGFLLEPSLDKTGVLESVLKSDGSGRKYLRTEAGGSLHPTTLETVQKRQHFVFQDGAPVFKYAVKGMCESVLELLEKTKLTADQVAWLVPHQANLRIIESTAERAKIPLSRVMVNIHKYGNTTAATIPLCIWEWEDQLKSGDYLVLAAFGGGFTWGATLLQWK